MFRSSMPITPDPRTGLLLQPMIEPTELLDDVDAMLARSKEDGYLFLPGPSKPL